MNRQATQDEAIQHAFDAIRHAAKIYTVSAHPSCQPLRSPAFSWLVATRHTGTLLCADLSKIRDCPQSSMVPLRFEHYMLCRYMHIDPPSHTETDDEVITQCRQLYLKLRLMH